MELHYRANFHCSIREDTAKYLRNLDPKSAYYDPKTRSMREDPYRDAPKRDPVRCFYADICIYMYSYFAAIFCPHHRQL